MKISENLSNLKNVIDKAAKNDLDSSATGSFLQNLEKANKETEKIYEKLENELKSDAQMFKQFDFMQMMTKLQYGNLKSSEREELINKMSKIAKEIQPFSVELNLAVLRKFIWFLLSKFAKKYKFTSLVAVNILAFATSFAKYLLHTRYARQHRYITCAKFKQISQMLLTSKFKLVNQ